MDTSNIPHTPYHIPSVGRLHPNIWGWWLGLTVLGGMVGEFLAAIPANAVGRFISAFDNGQLLKVFPVVGYIELLIYGLLCGIGLGVCHWFINNRMDDTKSPRTRGWLWIASWTVVILLELRFRSSPYNDPWIIQSMVLGLITGSIGGGIQLVTLRHTLKYAVIWVMIPFSYRHSALTALTK